MISKAIAGDYSGEVKIQVGTLWHGPSAKKFEGLHFIDKDFSYKPLDIKHLVYLSKENIKSFLGSSPANNADGFIPGNAELYAGDHSGGNQTLIHLGIEFKDDRKIILLANDNRILQCLLLFAEAEGIIE